MLSGDHRREAGDCDGAGLVQLEDHFTRTRAIRRDVIELHQAGTFKATEPEEDD